MSPPNTKDRGSTLVFTAIAVAVILAFSAIAIDLGVIATAKSQLQTAMDASSLAGASGLFKNEDEATQRAITFAGLNDCINRPVVITADNVTFPEANRVRVEAMHPIALYFARVIGKDSAYIHAAAEAEIGPLSGTSRVKPWAIPDYDYVLGQLVMLKSGSSDPPDAATSFFYCVDFPPINKGTPETGGSVYLDNVIGGSRMTIEIGDMLQIEPGNMVGPTAHGINDLISRDPDAYWNLDENTIENSLFPEFTSPRVCKVAMYDFLEPPNEGRNYVTVVRLGAFFLEETQGNDVYGRFISIATGGTPGNGNSDLVGVRLVK
jgi:hypothetical protein